MSRREPLLLSDVFDWNDQSVFEPQQPIYHNGVRVVGKPEIHDGDMLGFTTEDGKMYSYSINGDMIETEDGDHMIPNMTIALPIPGFQSASPGVPGAIGMGGRRRRKKRTNKHSRRHKKRTHKRRRHRKYK